jgi:hypothetical protein
MNLPQTTATVLIVLLGLIIVGLLIILIRTRRLAAAVPQPLLIVDEEVEAPQLQPLRISRYPLFHVPTHQGIWNVPHEPPHGPYNLPNGARIGRGPHYYK